MALCNNRSCDTHYSICGLNELRHFLLHLSYGKNVCNEFMDNKQAIIKTNALHYSFKLCRLWIHITPWLSLHFKILGSIYKAAVRCSFDAWYVTLIKPETCQWHTYLRNIQPLTSYFLWIGIPFIKQMYAPRCNL